VPGRVVVDGQAGTMPEPQPAREKTDCWGTVPHWDGVSDEMTAASGETDRGCESADS
jgi:hypothetical protein